MTYDPRLRFLMAITGAVAIALCTPVVVPAQTTPVPSPSAAASEGVQAWHMCAMYYNQGKFNEALSACDRAIALDPRRADAYFVKGSVMFGSSTVDANGKAHAPAGTAETLKKYLELAPDGVHRADVLQMLEYIQASPTPKPLR